jgi:hypothetical protein
MYVWHSAVPNKNEGSGGWLNFLTNVWWQEDAKRQEYAIFL